MRLRELEARVLKLERDPSHGPLARLSDAELEAMVIRELNTLAADFATYDALIDNLAASPEPIEQECAKNLRTFLTDYIARHQPQAAQ